LALNRHAAEMPTIGSGFDGSVAARKTFIMVENLIGLVAGIAIITGSATLFAQEGNKPANVGEGTAMVKCKNYPLKTPRLGDHGRLGGGDCGAPERSNDFKREDQRVEEIGKKFMSKAPFFRRSPSSRRLTGLKARLDQKFGR
jgi:hypothetical protein